MRERPTDVPGPGRVTEMLLHRSEVTLDEDRIRQQIGGRTLLISGAAGSVGAELCRQAVRLGADGLVMLDSSEGGLFDIDRELEDQKGGATLVPVVADIRDARAIREVFRDHPIDFVVHAAAYKHVPMMERQPIEAVHNNTIGTWNLLAAARGSGVSDFVLISTDKAVNPASVMGASKRVAELIVTHPSRSDEGQTRSIAVRFGNVLGSRGSVVPIFRSQIASGGPVTVTHPEASRFFMSVREAALMVLEAMTLKVTGSIVICDLEAPVRIFDLAERMIRLAGRVPMSEVEIVVTGLRPGEKLVEELAFDYEHMEPTPFERVLVCRNPCNLASDPATVIEELETLIRRRERSGILTRLQSLVPEYRPRPN